MKTVLRIVAAVIGLVVAVWLGRVLFPGDETKLKRLVEDIATAASFSGKEGDLGRLTKAATVASYFAGDVTVRVDVVGGLRGGLDGRDEIRQAAVAAMNSWSSMRVKVYDPVVTLTGEDTAKVELTASMQAGGTSDFNAQEFALECRKVDGKWLIARVESVRTLQR